MNNPLKPERGIITPVLRALLSALMCIVAAGIFPVIGFLAFFTPDFMRYLPLTISAGFLLAALGWIVKMFTIRKDSVIAVNKTGVTHWNFGKAMHVTWSDVKDFQAIRTPNSIDNRPFTEIHVIYTEAFLKSRHPIRYWLAKFEFLDAGETWNSYRYDTEALVKALNRRRKRHSK